MTLTVHPDPQEPAGGFAFLELPDGSLPGDEVHVSVFDAYGERWLAASEPEGARIGIGDPHWQPERFDFGPYPVYRHEGADWVRIGPEIVNKIEEYAPLKIAVGADEYDVTWPDDVPPRAGAAVLGGLRPVGRSSTEKDQVRLVGRAEPAAQPTPEPEPMQDDTLRADTFVPPPPTSASETGTRRRTWLVASLLLVLVLIGAGAAAWWFWLREQPADVAAAPPVPVSTAPVTDGDQCTPTALAAIGGGFGAVEAQVRACGQGVSPDTALALVEEYAAREDADALFLFGTLYDGDVLDSGIETLIGLTFAADDARAAEYYARAVKAGSGAARDRLTATCARLAGSTSTLAKGAYDDFCG